MATQILTNAFVLINAVDLSDHVKQVELSQSVDMQDATAMNPTSGTKVSAVGLKDWTLKVTFLQDFAASKVDATIWPLIGSTMPIEVRANNAARSAANPGWTGTGMISSYNPASGSVGEEQVAAVQIEAGSSLIRNIV